MSYLVFSDGLLAHPRFKIPQVPMFLDNQYRLLEVPTNWIVDKSKKHSKSIKTRKVYAYKLQKFLNWLDETGHGSQNWANVDVEIFDEFLVYLCDFKENELPPDHTNISYYAYRIWDFYKWTRNNGYEHYLDLDVQEVEIKVTEQLLLAYKKNTITTIKLGFNLPTGRPALLHRERTKFVTREDFSLALQVLRRDDVAYAIIAFVLGSTALRPKEFFQLPYRGKGQNSGFVDYDVDNIPADLNKKSIPFHIESKGKRRVFEFPGSIWRTVCEQYIPLRRERAELHKKKYGIYPPNTALFLNDRGEIITYRMMSYQFSKVADKAKDGGLPYQGDKFDARMLRHMFATYYVYKALERKGRIGKSYEYDPSLDEELRKWMGHEDIETTYKYYVHLINSFIKMDILQDIAQSNIDDNSRALAVALEIGGGAP
jgi:integrase